MAIYKDGRKVGPVRAGAAAVVVAVDAGPGWPTVSNPAKGIYICDGTADDVQIQAAIDALPAGGGKVVLSDGKFTFASPVTLDGDQDNITIEGMGPGDNNDDAGTTIEVPSGVAAFVLGDGQTSGKFINYIQLAEMRIQALGGNQDVVTLDYAAHASFRNLNVAGGQNNFIIQDVDRSVFENIDSVNPTRSAYSLRQGAGGFSARNTFINCNSVLGGTNDTVGVWVEKKAGGSSNPYAGVVWIGGLFFTTHGLTGTKNWQFDIPARSFEFLGGLFENGPTHVELNAEAHVAFRGTEFMYGVSGTATDDIFYFADGGAVVKVYDCTFQWATNLFTAAVNYPRVEVWGENKNDGNIDNIWNTDGGAWGLRQGSDNAFAGDGILVLGDKTNMFDVLTSKRFHLEDGVSAPGGEAGVAKLYVDTADGDLKIVFGDGTVKTIVVDT